MKSGVVQLELLHSGSSLGMEGDRKRRLCRSIRGKNMSVVRLWRYGSVWCFVRMRLAGRARAVVARASCCRDEAKECIVFNLETSVVYQVDVVWFSCKEV